MATFIDVIMTLQVILFLFWIRTNIIGKYYMKAMNLIWKMPWEERLPWLEYYLERLEHKELSNIMDLTKWSFKQYFPKIAELEINKKGVPS